MIISNQQRAALANASLQAFVSKTKKHICETYPEHSLSRQSEALEKKIQDIVTFAFAYSIKAEINILNLVILLLDQEEGEKLSAEQVSLLKHKQWDEFKRTEEFYLNTLLYS
jgi:hypothetical protein